MLRLSPLTRSRPGTPWKRDEGSSGRRWLARLGGFPACALLAIGGMAEAAEARRAWPARQGDPVVEIGFETASSTVEESAGTVELRVVLSAPSSTDLELGLSVAGTAGDADRTLESPLPLIVPAGETEALVRIAVRDDPEDEPLETVELELTVPEGSIAGSSLLGARHVLSVQDDDAPPSVGFHGAASRASESGTELALEIELSALSGFPVTVPFSLGGDALEGEDYTVPASPLVVPAGARSVTLTVKAVDDSLDEPDETVVVILGAPTNATLGADAVQVVTLEDDEAPPVIDFEVGSRSLGEGARSARVEVRLSEPSGQEIAVSYGFSGSATPGEDYVDDGGVITIAAGATRAGFDVTLLDDDLDEEDELLTVSLGAPSHATLGAVVEHVITLTDDDATPRVELALASQSVGEAAGVARVAAYLTSASSFEVVVPYQLAGSASPGDDYSLALTSLVFPAGELEAEVLVEIADDALHEHDETVELRLGPAEHVDPGGQQVHLLNLEDDDAPPSARFSSATSSVGETAGTAHAWVELSAPSGLDVTLPFQVGGNAEHGKDYLLLTPGPLVLPAGSQRIEIALAIEDDALHEIAESIVVELGEPQGATLGSLPEQVLTILSDDPPPTVSFTSSAQAAGEGTGTVGVLLELSAISGADVRVPLVADPAGGPGQASEGVDFSLGAAEVLIPAGNVSASAAITLLADALHEGPELAVVRIADPVGAEPGPIAAHELSVLDDDPPPAARFALATLARGEKAAPVAVEVLLDAPSALDVILPYSLAGSAQSGEDYQIGAGPLVIPAGAVKGTLTFQPLDDLQDEPAVETASVTLETPEGALLGTPSTFTVELQDDDLGVAGGNGLYANVSELAFPTTRVGQASAPQTVVVTNGSDSYVEFTGIELEGPGSGSFAVDYVGDQPPFGLEPGASTSVWISFQPKKLGPRQALARVCEAKRLSEKSEFAVIDLSGLGLGVSGAELLVNAGPQAHVDGGDVYWARSYGEVGPITFVTTEAEIAGTDEDDLYRSARVGEAFGYSIPLPDGEYEVRLHFAEIEARSPRCFDVLLEGQAVLTDFDPCQSIGHSSPTALVLPVTGVAVTDGQFDLEVVASAGQGLLSAFEVRSVPVLAPDSSAVDFGVVELGGLSERVVTLANAGLCDGHVHALTFRSSGPCQSSADFFARVGGQDYPGSDELVEHALDLVVPAGSSASFSLFFQPTHPQNVTFRLALATDDGPLELAVSGATPTVLAGLLHPDIDCDPPLVVDYDGDGLERVRLSAAGSHTHDPDHRLARYRWRVDREWAGEDPVFERDLPLGASDVELSVQDDGVPPGSSIASTVVRVHSAERVPGVLLGVHDLPVASPLGIDEGPLGPARWLARRPTLKVDDRHGPTLATRLEEPVVVRLQAAFEIQDAPCFVELAPRGGAARSLVVDGVPRADRGGALLAPGWHQLEARFLVEARSQLPLDVEVRLDGRPAPDFALGLVHSEVGLPPVLAHVAADSGTAVLEGFAFQPADEVVVQWGDLELTGPDLALVSPERIELVVPHAGPARVRVVTPAGTSASIQVGR